MYKFCLHFSWGPILTDGPLGSFVDSLGPGQVNYFFQLPLLHISRIRNNDLLFLPLIVMK